MLPFDDHTERLEATVAGPGDGSWFVAASADGALHDVHGVVPGDRVLLVPDPRRPGRKLVDALLAEGAARRRPPCPLAARCGGCHWLQADEASQQAWRRERLAADLRGAGVGGLLDGLEIRTLPGGDQLAHRHRARFQTDFADGRRIVGFHELGSPASLDVAECPALAPALARVYGVLRAWLRERRPADLTGFEVTTLPSSPGALVYLNPRDREPADWPELGEELLDVAGGLVAGVAVRSNAEPSRLGAKAILGRTPQGHPIAVAARGFLQANLAAADQLADFVALRAGHAAQVAELFCGSGLLGHRIAQRGASVLGTESSADAVGAARLLPAPGAGRYDVRLQDSRLWPATTEPTAEPEVLVADPPRDGLGPLLSATIATHGPQRVVLVACSTRSLAADLGPLAAGGYRLRELVQVDLFPQTRHAETVAVLDRG